MVAGVRMSSVLGVELVADIARYQEWRGEPMESSKRHRGPLCGATNAVTIDSGTLVRGRSLPPGVQLLSIAALSTEAKLEKCLRYTADALPNDVREEFRALLRPEAIGAMAV